MEDCVKNKIFLHFDDGKNRGGQKMCGVYLPKLFAIDCGRKVIETRFSYIEKIKTTIFSLYSCFLFGGFYIISQHVLIYFLSLSTQLNKRREKF